GAAGARSPASPDITRSRSDRSGLCRRGNEASTRGGSPLPFGGFHDRGGPRAAHRLRGGNAGPVGRRHLRPARRHLRFALARNVTPEFRDGYPHPPTSGMLLRSTSRRNVCHGLKRERIMTYTHRSYRSILILSLTVASMLLAAAVWWLAPLPA